jgi:hypothetical protein
MHLLMADHETPEGEVLALHVEQSLSAAQSLIRRGRVIGQELLLSTKIGNNPAVEKKIPWNSDSIGMWAEELIYAQRKIQPGDRFKFRKFVPELDTHLLVQVEAGEPEETALLDGKTARLLKVVTKIQKVESLELPQETVWLSADREPVKRQSQIPGLGQIVTFRTTKDRALQTGMVVAGKPAPDVGIGQLVRLKQPIPQPHQTTEVVYDITVTGVEDPTTSFPSDDRQTVRKGTGNRIQLTVRGLDSPPAGDSKREKPGDYLKSNHFIRSDDAKVKQFAREASRDAASDWEKAKRIESWVHKHLKNKNYSTAFATADEVARTLEGDCTEHAILASAMCRALDVPTRPVVGLVYVSAERSMGYHMWLEVWIDGKWYALDPTLGQGKVGACHIKIADHHWNDVQGFKPLLPVVQVIGRVQMEVASVKP